MLDSKDRDTIGQATEIFYELLNSCRTIVDEQIPVLIVCNKQDSDMAQRATALETELEKELNDLKRIKAATKDTDKQFVGYMEKLSGMFHFTQLADFVQVCEASVKNNEVDEIVNFIVKRHS